MQPQLARAGRLAPPSAALTRPPRSSSTATGPPLTTRSGLPTTLEEVHEVVVSARSGLRPPEAGPLIFVSRGPAVRVARSCAKRTSADACSISSVVGGATDRLGSSRNRGSRRVLSYPAGSGPCGSAGSSSGLRTCSATRVADSHPRGFVPSCAFSWARSGWGLPVARPTSAGDGAGAEEGWERPSPVGGEADLPQGGQVGQPLGDHRHRNHQLGQVVAMVLRVPEAAEPGPVAVSPSPVPSVSVPGRAAGGRNRHGPLGRRRARSRSRWRWCRRTAG